MFMTRPQRTLLFARSLKFFCSTTPYHTHSLSTPRTVNEHSPLLSALHAPINGISCTSWFALALSRAWCIPPIIVVSVYGADAEVEMNDGKRKVKRWEKPTAACVVDNAMLRLYDQDNMVDGVSRCRSATRSALHASRVRVSFAATVQFSPLYPNPPYMTSTCGISSFCSR